MVAHCALTHSFDDRPSLDPNQSAAKAAVEGGSQAEIDRAIDQTTMICDPDQLGARAAFSWSDFSFALVHCIQGCRQDITIATMIPLVQPADFSHESNHALL